MDLSLDLSEFPRKCFGHLPTKLESMPNLSKHVGAGVNLYIKRDDCTGIAGGGNKVRKLEFLVGDAIEHGADTLITQGAFQSNHARQTVACGAKVGMKCHVLLEDRTGGGPKEFYNNGNVMLNHLMGASVESYDGGTNMNAKMEETQIPF